MKEIDENISTFLNNTFPEIVYIERYNGTFTSIKGGKVLFVEKLSNTRKNCYTSIHHFNSHKKRGLEVELNKTQPSNTIYMGNISFPGLLEYYIYGTGLDDSISFSVYKSIIIGYDAYDEKGEVYEDCLPVFIDIDFIKNQFEQINKSIIDEDDYLVFDKLYVKLCWFDTILIII